MAKTPSPEKRLLEIIEGRQPQNPVQASLNAGKKYFSAGSLRAMGVFLKGLFKQNGIKAPKLNLDLKSVNLILQGAISLAVIALIISVNLDFRFVSSKELFPAIENAQADVQLAAVPSLLRPAPFYVEKAAARDIFRFADERREKAVNFKEEQPQETVLSIAAKDLKLVGISWSLDPDAIIENEKLEKTYFVKKGYMINDMTVKDILKDRVILRYQGEEVEIK